MSTKKQVVVSGGFDDVRARDIRFLEEAAKFGELTVLLWSDETVARLSGSAPKFPAAERQYLLHAIRYVRHIRLTGSPDDLNSLPEVPGFKPHSWVVDSSADNSARKAYCARHSIEYRVLGEVDLSGFHEPQAIPSAAGRKKVVVTGCYDWFHSGHVRFFEEVSANGNLYVVVGSDANVKLLKGSQHPMHDQNERRYAVGSVRFVTQALISSGKGWLDAEPEIERIKPDIYAVNEDGDKGGKREFCEKHGIEYLVLKRTPAPGLPARTSTDLRGY
jgi:cytidyltransferase-like protein